MEDSYPRLRKFRKELEDLLMELLCEEGASYPSEWNDTEGESNMPTYNYTCQDCKRSFERHVPVGARDNVQCEYCQSNNIQRNIQIGGIAFKGPGFYTTDYKQRGK